MIVQNVTYSLLRLFVRVTKGSEYGRYHLVTTHSADIRAGPLSLDFALAVTNLENLW